MLALLVEGLPNEIADRLTLSPKTVGHHISGVLGKLGVSTRGWCSRRGAAPGPHPLIDRVGFRPPS